MSDHRSSRRLKALLLGALIVGVVVGATMLFGYVQREMAFGAVWVDGDRGDRAGVYLSSCSLNTKDIERLLDLLTMCYDVKSSERIGQLLDRSAPVGWKTSEKAVNVADRLVTSMENLLDSMTQAVNDAQVDEANFAREHNGAPPNEADRSKARANAIFALERNGINPSRVAALVTGLGYVGAGSPEAQRCLTERLSDKRKEVVEAAEKALQRLGKPIKADAP